MTKPTITFYNWNGYACRIHETKQGSRTADLYRGGVGLVEVCPTDVWWESKQISKKHYQELVREEIALYKKREAREQSKEDC